MVLNNLSYADLGKYEKPLSFDVILADFGFNNLHISLERGFSWLKDEPLEMRYSSQYQTCAQYVKYVILLQIQHCSMLELQQIFEKYSDLKESKQVAERIFHSKPIKTTFELRDSIVGCFQKQKQRKIAQVFQSLRIAVNRQMQDIEALCQSLETKLSNSGLTIFITFHSIQRERIFKKIKQKGSMFSKIEIESPIKSQLAQNSMSRSAKILTFRKSNKS